MGKIFVGFLAICAIIIGVYTFTRSHDVPVVQQSSDNFLDMQKGKKGDDPIYSEEIKRNTALALTTGDEVNELKRQLEDMKLQKADADKLSISKIDALNASIEQLKAQSSMQNQNNDDSSMNEMQRQFNDKITSVVNSVESLSDNIAKSRKQTDDKITALETLVTTQTLPPQNSPIATESVKIPATKSTVTYAYGYPTVNTKSNNETKGVIDQVTGKFNDTFSGIGKMFNRTTGKETDANAIKHVSNLSINNDPKEEWETVFPVYTLPPNTVLANSTLLTPIIGRVPLSNSNSSVTDPFFFKVEIGSDNLAANGHKIPGVAKMIASGYSTGIREQSCVRGYIDSITYIFIDGRIVTQGEVSKDGNSNGDAIGYLADQWGKPCIRGRYINNAKDYLKSRGASAFLEAAAEGLAQSQVSYTQNESGKYQAVLDGNVWSFILGRGIGGSANELANYVRERTANAFDVVYVKQAQRVQIWLNKSLNIDYDSQARKIQYYAEPSDEIHYD